MKDVLAFIASEKQKFAQLPFFAFMRDTILDPMQRFAFVPCMAPFAASFRDFNIHTLRQEPTTDAIQQLINRHTYEDETHYRWYLEDLEKMGFNQVMRFSDALQFLWGEKTLKTRQVCYELYRLYTTQTEPLLKLVVIESIEETGNVAFAAFSQAGIELQQLTQKRYRYYGSLHLAAEDGHIQGNTQSLEDLLAEITLTEALRTEAYMLIKQVFQVFTEFMNECLVFAQTQSVRQPFASSRRSDLRSAHPKRLGAYLVEAGLITTEQLSLALDEQTNTSQRLGELVAKRGWIQQTTIEYMMEKVVLPEQQSALLKAG